MPSISEIVPMNLCIEGSPNPDPDSIRVQDTIYCIFAEVAPYLLKREGENARLRFLIRLGVHGSFEAADSTRTRVGGRRCGVDGSRVSPPSAPFSSPLPVCAGVDALPAAVHCEGGRTPGGDMQRGGRAPGGELQGEQRLVVSSSGEERRAANHELPGMRSGAGSGGLRQVRPSCRHTSSAWSRWPPPATTKSLREPNPSAHWTNRGGR
jgi:hypothetical protein